ncbi:hypothetical protein WJX82_010970 [Trebouxia sp. C0006]
MSRVGGGFSIVLPVKPCLTRLAPFLQTATQSPRRPLLTPLKALHIDRRQHLELAWQRQQVMWDVQGSVAALQPAVSGE